MMHLIGSIVAGRIAEGANDRSGSNGPHSLHPHADVELAHELSSAPVGHARVAAGWRLDIGSPMPAPAVQTCLNDLLEFRKEHRRERAELMHAINRLLRGLVNDHPEDALRDVRHELSSAMEEMRERARKRRVALARSSTVVTVAASALALGEIGGNTTGAIALKVLGDVSLAFAPTLLRSGSPESSPIAISIELRVR